MKDLKKLSKGFTMMELLIVVSILVILGLALMIGLNPLKQIFKTHDAIRKTDLQKLKVALEAYYEDRGCYPAFIELTATMNNTTDEAMGYYTLNHCGSQELMPYLDAIPCDPATKQPYSFTLPSNFIADKKCPQAYTVYAKLDNITDPDGKRIPGCTNTIAVFNEGAIPGAVGTSICGSTLCAAYYGCVNGKCQKLTEYATPPNCSNYCNDPNCGGRCTNSRYANSCNQFAQ